MTTRAVARRSPRDGGALGRADMHLHTLYSDGTIGVQALLDHIEHHTSLDLVAITDHERIDGAQRAAEIVAAGDYHFELVVGEEITTRRGHLLGLFLTERVPALRPLEESIERIHDQGGLAVAAHPLAPLTPSIGRRSLVRLHQDPDARHRLDGIEMLNPSVAGRARRGHRHLLNKTLELAALGNSDAHVLEHVGTGWTRFPGITGEEYRAAVAARTTTAEGEYWTHWHNVSVYARQLVAKARHVRHTLRPTGEWR
ncbi:MAG TPA: PHP-associated domain-containing protein [Candidatus Limnocylindria bacterium]|nr:PHP-associated domain-containing protein [Candidatus Limnocylindria bacterium]